MIESSVSTASNQYVPIAGLAPDPAACHPLSNLLDLSVGEILASYRNSQLSDFTRTLAQAREGNRGMMGNIELLSRYLESYPTENFVNRLQVDSVEKLFRRMHDHIMSHPVWVHPFFARITEGNISFKQLTLFAQHYFNQVKNTRQCVALALGRFHTLIDRPEGQLNNALSELTQVVLAGLLRDEYGTGAGGDQSVAQTNSISKTSSAVDIRRLFASTTHPDLFRRFLDALGVSTTGYDVPMLHGVADNVLVQRILSGNSEYDELEALASVGLGMEWGVPAFFSMIMAGISKVAQRENIHIDPAAMEIWSSHVSQDVEHAIAVMIVTSFYVNDEVAVRRVEGATNVLMAFRYDMMSDIYREVFNDPCQKIADIDLEPRYFLHDRRIEALLCAARLQVRPAAIRDYNTYRSSTNRLVTL